MAKKMSVLLRWGNSCGIPFDATKFCSENRVWDYLLPYLQDRPQQPWTEFTITNKLISHSKTRNKRVKKSKTLKSKNKKITSVIK
jgi:hypothetical protein